MEKISVISYKESPCKISTQCIAGNHFANHINSDTGDYIRENVESKIRKEFG